MRNLLGCLITLLSAAASAQPLQLLELSTDPASSRPQYFIELEGRTVFVNGTATLGQELWVTNGTDAGTHPIADLCAGTCGYIRDPVRVGSQILFFAFTKEYGLELWRSDGTNSGTAIVKDIRPGAESITAGVLNDYAIMHGVLYVGIDDGIHGLELWRSDGTEQGTRLVKDIADGFFSADVKDLVVSEGVLYFSATNGTHGVELWRSDGTDTGTWMVADIYPGAGASAPLQKVDANGILYFAANDGVHGEELWKSDGTSQGTRLVRDIHPGAVGSRPANMTAVDDKVVFLPNSAFVYPFNIEPWVSDGTPDGTMLLTDINPGEGGSMNPNNVVKPIFPTFFSYQGKLFFSAVTTTAAPEYYYYALWETDGTSSNTRIVKHFGKTTGASMVDEVDGLLYFYHNDMVGGLEMWRTDGTNEGTQLCGDIRVGSGSSVPSAVSKSDQMGKLYFGADDGIHGNELWLIDGNADPYLVKDIEAGSASSYFGPSSIIGNDAYVYGGASTFSDNSAMISGLYKTNATPDGTSKVAQANFTSATELNGSMIFAGFQIYTSQQTDIELWTSDGTAGGTRLLKDIYTSGSSWPKELVKLNSIVLFSASSNLGTELWKTDGTAQGTSIVKDIYPGNFLSSFPRNLTVMGGWVYFTVFLPAPLGEGVELWRTDGTSDGTTKVSTIRKDIASSATYNTLAGLKVFDGVLYFCGHNSERGNELWRSDGTPVGTYPLTDISPGAVGSVRSTFFPIAYENGKLFFPASDGIHGIELWTTSQDGTGTRLLKDINEGPGSASIREILSCRGRVYFNAFSPQWGDELWQSDGTTEGTTIVKDLAPGERWSHPTSLTLFQDLLYFGATNGSEGRRLHKTDGTSIGTFTVIDDLILTDLYTNQTVTPRDNVPLGAVLNDRLIFPAIHPLGGNELWGYSPIPALALEHEGQHIESQIQFGSVREGESLTKAISLQNTRLATGILRLSSFDGITVTGENSGDFIVHTNGTVSQVSPSTEVPFSIEFKPTAEGTRRANLVIQSNDPNRPVVSIELQGSGQPTTYPVLEVSSSGVVWPAGVLRDIGRAFLNESLTIPIFIKNTGTGPLNVDLGAFVINFSSSQFELEDGSFTTINVGETRSVLLKIFPTREGVHTCTFRIGSVGKLADYEVQVHCNVEARKVPKLSVIHDGRSLASGETVTLERLKKVESSTTLWIRNNGDAPLELESSLKIQLASKSPGEFVVDQSAVPRTILPGAEYSFQLTFKPKSSGKREAALTILSNDPATPLFRLSILGNSHDDSAERLFIPTVFSPDGNGVNDYFIVRSNELVEWVRLIIVDRLGQVVFTTVDKDVATGQGWDGTIEGQPADEGIYTWILQGKFEDGLPLVYQGKTSGNIMLKR